MSSDRSPAAASHHPDTTASMLEVDAVSLPRTLREQKALPLTAHEAETLACALESSGGDEEFLANTLAAVRLLIDRLEPLDPAS